MSQEPVKCIHLCFKWLYRLLFYTGCLSFRLTGEKFHLTRFTKIYANVIRLILLIGFIGGFTMKLNDEESVRAMLNHLPPILKFIMAFEGITCTITYMEVSFILDWQKYKHIKLAEQFQYLDDCMRKEFPQISWNYHKSIRKYTPLTIVVMIYYTVVSMIYLFNITHCNCDLLNTFILAISYALLTVSPGTAAFLLVGSMDILRLRYRLICRLLAQIKDNRKNIRHREQIQAVHRLTVYCRRYTELIFDMNSVFGLVMAAGIFYDFGILTNLVYLICQKVFVAKAPIEEYIFIFLFMLPRMYKLIITPIYGKLLEKEKQRCIHSLMVYADEHRSSIEVQDLFQAFLQWKMLLGNCNITIGSAIRCNLNIIFMVLNGIANYVIILIQLQFQQNIITDRVRNYNNFRRTADLVEMIKVD